MNWIYQKILQRYQPRVLVFAGQHGKSMAMAATSFVLRSQGKTVAVVEHSASLPRALLALGHKRWRVQALLQALGWRPYPAFVLVEMDRLPSADILSSAQATVVLTSVYEGDMPAVPLIYNTDTLVYPEFAKKDKSARVSYGIDHSADFQAEFIELIAADDAKLTGSTDPRWRGMQAKVKQGGSVLPLRLAGGLGRVHVYAALAAVAVSDALGIHALDGLKSLREFVPLPGRMTLVPGIKKSLIIDDSYCIDPVSAMQAFHEGAMIPSDKTKKRFAVVGEMADTGAESAEQHQLIGKALAELGYSAVVAIGERTTDILHGAEQAGLSRGQLFHFIDVVEAGKFLQRELKRGELLVVKGGADLKLERIVKELMAFPLRAKADLVQR